MTAPVPHGNRLIIAVIDERADQDHAFPFCYLPISSDPADGFRPVSYRSLRTAVDHVAHFLDGLFGPGSNTTFAWLAPPTDFRYLLLAFAAMKTGHVAFFPSPRNSLEAHLALLDSSKSTAVLRPIDASVPVIDRIIEHKPVRLADLPKLDDLLNNSTAVAPYPFAKSFAAARLDPCLIVHTSGSTGIPKPIVIKHAWFSPCDAYHDMPSLGAGVHGIKALERLKVFVAFPNFHAAGLIFRIACAIFWDFAFVDPPSAPLTAEVADQCRTISQADAAFLPTSVIRDLTQNPSHLAHLEQLKYLLFAGSPIAEDVGDVVQRRTHLLNVFGITESCMAPFEMVGPDDWGYMKYGPHTGVEFRPFADDHYEMVFVRTPHLERFQAIFVTEPDCNEWHTKDLWTKHPTKPDLWHYEGRLDDIIVLSNGEKLNPLSMEQSIEAHPLVAGAVVAGAGRFQTCLLIEPRPDTCLDSTRLLERIWPAIHDANLFTVAHGRVSKELVLVTTPQQPFIRADKGTIKKKMTVAALKDDIEALYHRLEAGMTSSSAVLDLSTLETAKRSLLQVITINSDIKTVADDQDFFSMGMDSLQASSIVRALNVASSGLLKLQPRDLYSHATLERLSAFVTGSDEAAPDSDSAEIRITQMTSMLESLISDLPGQRPTASVPASNASLCVLLTGSTGSLGTYLLDGLIRNAAVIKVYCLNRAQDAAGRQLASHESRGLATDFSKVVFIQSRDFSAPRLSVDDAAYQDMLQSVTHVIHNAWPVDFNRDVLSFESHVHGVGRMVEFCASSACDAALSFLGTISSVSNWRGADGREVPEQIFTDWSTSQPMGYASSKQVAEVLLDAAAHRSGVATTVMRLGQVAGPVLRGLQGMWNKQEFVPSLIASSCHLRKIPVSLGAADRIDWMPVDLLSEALLQVALAPSASRSASPGARVRHFVNPSAAEWQDLLPAICEAVPQARRPAIVSFAGWMSALQGSAAEENLTLNPALKLLPHFERLSGPESGRMAVLDPSNSVAESPTLKDLKAVDGAWMDLWMRQWAF